MITQEEINDFIELFWVYDPYDATTLEMMDIIYSNPIEDFQRFMELYRKFEKICDEYVKQYFILHHEICGIDSFNTGYYNTNWQYWDRFYFKGIRRRKSGQYSYPEDTKYPDGYCWGEFFLGEDEDRTFKIPIADLLQPDYKAYLTEKCNAALKQQKIEQQQKQSHSDAIEYQTYLILKEKYESRQS